MSRLGDNLREARIRAGFTQGSLAKDIGVLGQTIYRWETGSRYPRPNAMDKLANALNITVAQLIGEADLPETATKQIKEGIGIDILQTSGRCNRQSSLSTRLGQIRDEIKDTYGKIDKHEREIIKATLSALEAEISAIENTEKEQIAEATQKMA